MKKLFTYSLTMALCSPMIFAAQQAWTGKISDAMCGSDHAMMQKGATKMSDKECVTACIKSGQKYVLVSGGKVYQIDNQTVAGLQANAGGTVTVTGEASADGKSITVATLKAAASAGASKGATQKATQKIDPNMEM
jgi:hypothetical protein